MNNQLLNKENGFTIVEVLVGAFIFMLGFSVLIFMLSRLMVNYSIDEISTSSRICQNHMEMAIVSKDTNSYSIVERNENITYSVTKRVVIENNLAKVNFEVKRRMKDKVLCRLYYEFNVCEN